MRHHILWRRIQPWPAPVNHLQNRTCPTCGANCHGWTGQDKMQEYHEKQDAKDRQFVEAITQICNFLGIKVTIADGEDWEWGAGVTGTEEAIEEGADA